MSTVLIVLDGWGQNPSMHGNAIKQASTPNYDKLRTNSLSSLLKTDGPSVGLPEGQCGNSEVGHLTLGLGRSWPHPRLKITSLLKNSLKQHRVPKELEPACQSSQTVHLVGLHSSGGIHGLDQLTYLWCEFYLTFTNKKIYLHLIADGRDVPYGTFQTQLEELKENLEKLSKKFDTKKHLERLSLASLTGRYYAMDRDKNEERTQTFTQALQGQTPGHKKTQNIYLDALCSLENVKNKSEEFLPPVVCSQYPGLKADDLIVNMNFRADRAVQWFEQIRKQYPAQRLLTTVPLGIVDEQILCPQSQLDYTLTQQLIDSQISQLRLTESEKEPHVTFFFDGLTHENKKYYHKKIFPSQKVLSWDQSWPMKALEIAEYAQKIVSENQYEFILINLVNADLVGHSGNFEATVKAIEHVDKALGIIIDALLKHNHLFVTADHGNAEQMLTHTGKPHTAHTNFPVELLYHGPLQKDFDFQPTADLTHVAATVLQTFSKKSPATWSHSLFLKKPA